MLLRTIALVAWTLPLVSAASKLTWTPCSYLTHPELTPKNTNSADCTVYSAPLCHPGVCEAPDSANATVDVYVRRVKALVGDPNKASNVWLLQGADYSASTRQSERVHDGSPRNWEKHTFEVRENASELQDPTDLDPPRIPACAKELEERYGDLAAFSTTSAAMDLASFISDYGNDFSTTVYGLKYGSLWVERLMHLNPPEVTGYVFDGPTTTSGAALENFYNVSSLNVASSEVADAFLDLCAEDSVCNARFGKKGLKATLTHLKARLDKNPTSTCAKLVTRLEYGEKTDPPSMALQNILGTLLGDMTMRTLIPPIVYKFLRCSKKDVGVLNNSTKASLPKTRTFRSRQHYF